MTAYTQKSFSVHVGGPAYSSGWDMIFGKKEPELETVDITDEVAAVRRGPISDIGEQVREFHTAMDLPIASTPAVPATPRLQLRIRLIAEEFFELLEACGGDEHLAGEAKYYVNRVVTTLSSGRVDMVEFADACADLDYVLEGARLEFGINGKPVAAEVHRSNMAKVGGPVREDGKIGKPDNWTPPDIRGELRKQGWPG